MMFSEIEQPKKEVEKVQYLRPKLYFKQERAFFNNARYSFIEGSTKCGKTHAGIVWLAEQAFLLGAEGRNFWWVAPVYGQARIAYKRMKRALPEGSFTKNETNLEITLFNGAVICFKSGEKPDNLYGEDVFAAIIDEASRLREESWHAVRSVVTATKGQIRAIGNVKGRSNWFFKLCRRAQTKEYDMFYDKITAYDAVEAGVLDMEEIEDAKQLLPEAVFRELYLAEPSQDEGNPFGFKFIDACYQPEAKALMPASYGADLAKSFDWTVLLGLDEHGVEAYFDRWQGMLGAAVDRIDNEVDGNICAVDSTGMGVRPAEELQAKSDMYIPYHFSSKSKQILMEGLAIAIQKGTVTIRSEIVKKELEAFEYEYTRTGILYSAPQGFHDDCVIALALAVYAKGQHIETCGVL